MTQDNQLPSADVVAVFNDQMAADEGLLQLRMGGISDSRIGYYVRHPSRGLTNLMNRDYAFAGAVIGGMIGTALGNGAARLVHQWAIAVMDIHDFFGVAVTCSVVMALFVGLIGWGIGLTIHARKVEAPAVGPTVGPLILVVSAGDERDRVWSILHRAGGHELPPGALMARPVAV